MFPLPSPLILETAMKIIEFDPKTFETSEVEIFASEIKTFKSYGYRLRDNSVKYGTRIYTTSGECIESLTPYLEVEEGATSPEEEKPKYDWRESLPRDLEED